MTFLILPSSCQFLATTNGSGNFIVASAVAGKLTPEQANVLNGAVHTYYTQSLDGTQWESGSGAYNVLTHTLSRTTIVANSNGDLLAVNFLAPPVVTVVANDSPNIDPAPPILDRQNALIDRFYQSKALAVFRRGLNVFADGYKNTDGVSAGSSSNYVVNTASGFVVFSQLISGATGTPTGNMSGEAGVAAAFDGVLSGLNSTGAGTAGRLASNSGFNNTIGKDWGVGNTKTIGKLIIYCPSNGGGLLTSATSTTVKLQGSQDAISFTDLTSAVTVPGTIGLVQTISTGIDVSTAYRYHLLNINGNGVNEAAIRQLQFFDNVPTTMTLVTTAQTVDASVSNGRVLLEYDNTAALTPGTDFTIEASCDGGSHWTLASNYVVATVNGQGGHNVIETNDMVCTPGTSVQARLKSFGSKNMPIYGTSLTVH